jgi:hypothetical protein
VQVFGETGGLAWARSSRDQLLWTPLGKPTMILERGVAGLSPEGDRASRVAVGHAEGFFGAFANIYRDLADVIGARKTGRPPDPLALSYPSAVDGLRSVAAVEASARSAAERGAWVDAVPRILRS